MDAISIRAVTDAIMKRFGLRSQPELARFLQTTEKTLSNWQHGRNYPDDRYCSLLAEHSGVDREAFAAWIQAQRATTPEGRKMWLHAVRRLMVSANFAVPDAMEGVANKWD